MKIRLLTILLLCAIPLLTIAQISKSTVEGAQIKLDFPVNTKKNKTQTRTAVYNAPPHCIIMSFKVLHKQDLGPTDFSFDFVAKGSRFISKQEMNQSFTDVLDLATKLNIQGEDYIELKGKLDQKHSNYEKYQTQIEASHSSIRQWAQIQGAGMFNGRTIHEAKAQIELLCIEDYLTNIISLNNHLETYVKDYSKTVDTTTLNSKTEPNNSPQNAKFSITQILIIILIIIGFVLIVIFIIRKKR